MPSTKSLVNVNLNWKAATNTNGIESLHGNGYALKQERRFAGIFKGDGKAATQFTKEKRRFSTERT